MLLATLLALTAAVMHAGWNFVAKRADGDRYTVLSAQFLMSGLIALPCMIGYQLLWGLPWQGYVWGFASGCVHLPYVWLLARAVPARRLLRELPGGPRRWRRAEPRSVASSSSATTCPGWRCSGSRSSSPG